ncbi:hypothetical protein RND81_12G237500 [Saponaria officinalis]|uniref:DNA polymerase delta subunit 3 n=1 Tax=Saponaria officinalis TaxID=3572 RepID=A0AAW1HEX1_SAPOF
MSEIDSTAILEEIQSLVSDHLQLVSYKWLSRKFLVSSNAAKRLLQQFAEKHEDELEVLYSVAGWLKETPATYHVKLVPKPKLPEAKHGFDGNCSVQVYSVQSCIPKDLVALWNAEFIQTEELFKQPSTEDNCLRDNRFCGVSNSFVKRNAEGTASAVTAVKAKEIGAIGTSANQSSPVPQPQKKLPQSSPKVGLQSSNVASAKIETSTGPNIQEAVKDKPSLPPSKKKGHSDKSPAGGSLANFWGRASSKSNSSKEDKDAVQKNGVPHSADAQICAIEKSEAVSSDDDEPDVNFRRASNGEVGKKRRVVIDDSDEEDFENAVNLGSPDPPKGKSFLELKQKNEIPIMENNLSSDKQEEIMPIKKEEKVTDSEIDNPFKNDFAALDQRKKVNVASSEEKKIPHSAPDVSTNKKNKATDPAPGSPKRKKVLKTRIDERGREGTSSFCRTHIGPEIHANDSNYYTSSTS